MLRIAVLPHSCPVPVMEALHAHLDVTGSGRLIGDPGEHDDPDDPSTLVELVYCDREERWSRLAEIVRSGSITVCMIANLDITDYARALGCGSSGVVYFDTPASTVVAVIESAIRGEVVMPALAAQMLAAQWVDEEPRRDVTAYELRLLQALSHGARISDVAESFSYSDRTIRRQLQNVYLKLGVSNRYEAIAAATRARLI